MELQQECADVNETGVESHKLLVYYLRNAESPQCLANFQQHQEFSYLVYFFEQVLKEILQFSSFSNCL